MKYNSTKHFFQMDLSDSKQALIIKKKKKRGEESDLCFWQLFASCGLQMEPRIVFANPSLS